jgi:predicted acetyltransferase
MSVTLTPAGRDQEPVFQNLFQLYTHDFSAFWAGTARGDLLPDGRFEPYPMDVYWTQPDRSAFLIHSEGVLAGFALANDHRHSGRPTGRSVAEFFILRKHRRGGVGRQAAEALFSTAPGVWEAAITRQNTAAAAFWRGIVAHSPRASDIEEIDAENGLWNGPIVRFNWR